MTKQQRLNKYACDKCGGSVITIDREMGVTPMFIACRAPRDEGLACMGMMASSMYRGVSGEPSFEWRAPTIEERAGLDTYTLEQHVDRGGLLIYPIPQVKMEG